MTTHAEACGDLCADDGAGCCSECGVSLVTCGSCDGIGYHRLLCPESDDTPRRTNARRSPRPTSYTRSDLP